MALQSLGLSSADLLNALYQANHAGLLAGQLGATYFIPTSVVPLLLSRTGSLSGFFCNIKMSPQCGKAGTQHKASRPSRGLPRWARPLKHVHAGIVLFAADRFPILERTSVSCDFHPRTDGPLSANSGHYAIYLGMSE
jgi:hypothetical protein